MSDDPYKALGVAKTATEAEIKKAYKKIVRESHPDLNPGDAGAVERFKAASAAHDLLKDPETRARFDRGEIDATGAERPERRYYRDYAGAGENAYHTTRGFEDFEDVSDIFADFIHRGGRGGHPRGGRAFRMRGQDLRYSLEIDFLDAARGATRRITLPDGQMLDVRIPEGSADGQTIRLRGKGAPGMGGGPAGDALVAISVRKHKFFRREGDDILLELPVTIDEALLGGKVAAPTLDGEVSLTIPRGASSGQVLRLRGKGVRRKDKRGDQKVTLKIVAPPEIDAELEAFLKTWAKTRRHDPRKGLKP